MVEQSKLNLGCGQFPKPGFVNVDVDPAARADVHHDLNQTPYPFDDGQFVRIECDHVLEHLDNPMAAMRECHRLLATGGYLQVRVPHFTRGFTHWDHKRGFDVSFPLYFDPGFAGGYSGIPLVHIRTRLIWFGQAHLKRQVLSPLQFHLGRGLGTIFDLLGNLNLYATSRLFSFYVGGYDEVEFTFAKSSS